MTFPDYSSALSWLYARNQFAMKMGLDKMRELLKALGNPENGGVYLHVAGTNGKGSVCAALAAMLPTLGVRRVGLYTSPHLVSFRERIRVDGQPVPADFVTGWLNRHIATLEFLNPTYFEIVTALALAWFREQGCGAVVLETGLGGRLDATNVVTPRVTAITSIALDHTGILGDTLEAVMGEKLGIVKAGIPLVIDEPRPALARLAAARIHAVAKASGMPDAPWINLAEHLSSATVTGAVSEISTAPDADYIVPGRYRDYTLPGDLRAEEYQRHNAALAVLALEAFYGKALPPEAIWLPALRSEGARMAGRMQRLQPLNPRYISVLLDGAHNPAAAHALRDHLSAHPPGKRPRIFFASMRDKDYLDVCRILRSLSDDLVFVDLSAENPRALSAAVLRETLDAETRAARETSATSGEGSVAVADCLPTWASLEPLLRAGTADVPGPDSAVFCGSLYLLGAIIPLLAPHYAGLEAFEGLLGETVDGRR